MSQTVIMENDSVALWFHPEKKIVHHKIKKWVFGPDFKTLLDKGYEKLKISGGKKWLSDDRGSGVVKPEDEKWVKEDWLPRVIKAGWKFWAIVLPEKAVGQMNMKRFKEEFQKVGLTVQVFTHPDEALKWLESV